MKKRIALLSSVILICFAAYILLGVADSTFLSRADFSFSLPLPEEIAQQFNVPRYPDIEKVILTGFFSDWDEYDENYRMIPETDDPRNQKWTSSISLPPGEHQYKYAVYLKDREEPVWTHDTASYKLVYNGMDSYNSLIRIGYFGRTRQVLLYIIYALLIVMLPQLFHVIFRKTSMKNSLLLLAVLLLISNLAFSLFNYLYDRQYYSFISRSIISILEYDLNQSDENRYETFNGFLWHKLDKIGIRDLEEKYHYVSLLYFDRSFRLSDFDYRIFEDYHVQDPLPLESSREFVFSYFTDQIEDFRTRNIDEVTYMLPSSERYYLKKHGPGLGKAFEDGTPFVRLSAKTYLFPYVRDNMIRGYLGIFFDVTSRSVIDSFLKFNIGALLFFVAIVLVLSFVRKDDGEEDEIQIRSFAEKYHITSRESDVLPYLVEGLTNKEIAESMNISKRTVDNHIYNILHKVSAKNRVELVHIIKKGL